MDMMLQWFGGGSHTNIKSQLTHIQQKSSVNDYLANFTRLFCWVTDMTENQLKHVFVGGPNEDICHEVLALELESLHQAHKLAKFFETKLQAKRSTRPNFPRLIQPLPPTPIPPTTIPIKQPPQEPHPCSIHPSNAERQQRCKKKRKKNECFSCNELYTPIYKCKTPMLLVLDTIQTEEEPWNTMIAKKTLLLRTSLRVTCWNCFRFWVLILENPCGCKAQFPTNHSPYSLILESHATSSTPLWLTN